MIGIDFLDLITPDPPPALLGGGEQLAGHRGRLGLRAGALRHPGAQEDGRERARDRDATVVGSGRAAY